MFLLQTICTELLNCLFVFTYFWFLNQFFTMRKQVYKKRYLIILFYYLFCVCINMIRYENGLFRLNPFVQLALTIMQLVGALLVPIVFYEGSVWYKLFLSFVQKSFEAVVAYVLKYAINSNPEIINEYFNFYVGNGFRNCCMFHIVTNAIVFLISALIVGLSRFAQRSKQNNWYFFTLIPLSQLLLFFPLHYFLWQGEASFLKSGWFIIVCTLLAVIGDISMHSAIEQLKKKSELEKTLMINQAQQKQCMAELSGIEAINRRQNMFYHDLRNQLAVAAKLMESGQKELAMESIASLSEQTQTASEHSFCANSVANTIINYKLIGAQEKGIVFDIDAIIPHDIPIMHSDMCSVFSNVIDNAVNALTDYDGERIMKLSARFTHGFFLLKETNPYNEVEDGHKAEKAEKDEAVHGLGLGILKYISEKYSGSLEINRKDGVFTLELSLALPAEFS